MGKQTEKAERRVTITLSELEKLATDEQLYKLFKEVIAEDESARAPQAIKAAEMLKRRLNKEE